MTDWVTWFRERLRTSGEDFIWAFEQIPAARHKSCPPNPRYLGLWEPARLVWHVTEYERWVALPVMNQWLGGSPLPDNEDVWPDTNELWFATAHQQTEDFIHRFWEVRHQQIALLDTLAAVDWAETRRTGWGDKPLSMVVTKTFQHTFEHGDTLLRMGVWWDDMQAEEGK